MTVKTPTTRARTWLLAAGFVAAVLALLAWAVVRMIPSDEELARQASAELESALGVPVSIAQLRWQLLPVPQVVLEDAATRQPQPVRIRKLTATLNPQALWQRRLRVDHALVQGAVVPQLSLRGLGRQNPSARPEHQAQHFSLDSLPVARVELQDVTWISRRGKSLAYEGEAEFDPGWRPRTARVRRPDAGSPAELSLARRGQEDHWTVRASLGGGTAHGELALQPGPQGGLRLKGALQPRNIEVATALEAFSQRSIIAGQASGETVLSASGESLGELLQTLHTATSFRMGRSTLLRFDLDQAIRSLGKTHAGTTPLDAVSGQLDTHNTPQGVVVSYSRLQTRSGALSASGQARVANRQIQAEVSVDLVDGVVGVPLVLSGPVDKPKVEVPASALAGAAVGTAVLPGVGTALGARIGAAIGKMLGAEPAGGPRPAPAPK